MQVILRALNEIVLCALCLRLLAGGVAVVNALVFLSPAPAAGECWCCYSFSFVLSCHTAVVFVVFVAFVIYYLFVGVLLLVFHSRSGTHLHLLRACSLFARLCGWMAQLFSLCARSR